MKWLTKYANSSFSSLPSSPSSSLVVPFNPVNQSTTLFVSLYSQSALWDEATLHFVVSPSNRHLVGLYNSIGATTKLRGVDEAPISIINNRKVHFQLPDPER